jgi:hypothetical protein
MNVYTDPKLLDVAGAMDALPSLSLVASESNVARATGTDNSAVSQFAPGFAPTTGKTITLQSIVDKAANNAERIVEGKTIAVTAFLVKRNKPLTSTVNGLHQERETGLEPATSSLGSYNAPVASDSNKGLTATPSDACTTACTSEGENANADALEASSPATLPQAANALDADQGKEGKGIDQGDPLANLAALIASLSPADRQRLTTMLTGHQDETEQNRLLFQYQ